MSVHNEYWCKEYNAEVLPDENGNFSLCGNPLVSAPLFEAGRVVATRSALDVVTADQITMLLMRHLHGDCGDLGKKDKAANDAALADGLRIFSAYGRGKNKIWIIAEADRSVTTILRPEEYKIKAVCSSRALPGSCTVASL